MELNKRWSQGSESDPGTLFCSGTNGPAQCSTTLHPSVSSFAGMVVTTQPICRRDNVFSRAVCLNFYLYSFIYVTL